MSIFDVLRKTQLKICFIMQNIHISKPKTSIIPVLEELGLSRVDQKNLLDGSFKRNSPNHCNAMSYYREKLRYSW